MPIGISEFARPGVDGWAEGEGRIMETNKKKKKKYAEKWRRKDGRRGGKRWRWRKIEKRECGGR